MLCHHVFSLVFQSIIFYNIYNMFSFLFFKNKISEIIFKINSSKTSYQTRFSVFFVFRKKLFLKIGNKHGLNFFIFKIEEVPIWFKVER